MKWAWRFQQVSGIISIVMWLGAYVLYSQNLLLGVLGLIGVCLFAWFYDRKAQMWEPQQEVQAERNPYSINKPYPKELNYTYPVASVGWDLLIDIARKVNANPKLINAYVSETDRMRAWYESWRNS